MNAQFKFLSGARVGQVETFRKAYIGLGRHPLSDVRFDVERDLDVSSRHAAIMRKPDGFVLQDLGSKNGTYVNGIRIEGDRLLADGDVIGFGAKGPAVEFHQVAEDREEVATATVGGGTAGGAAPGPAAPPRRPSEPPPAHGPRHSGVGRTTTAIRAAIEVATKQWRRTTKVLFGVLILVVGLAGFVLWKGGHDRKTEIARIRAWADSVGAQSQRTAHQFQTEVEGLRLANQQSLAEIQRLRQELANAGSDAGAVARLRTALEAAQQRQQLIAGASAVDYRGISQRNQDAVALVLVEFSESERFSGTAFAVDAQGTLVTNKHVLVGENGDRVPRRIAVKFSGSRQWFPGRYLGVSDGADIGALKVEIRGGTPQVLGVERDPRQLQRGDPVAIIGYPLGFDLPMEGQGLDAAASPTLTVGTTSKVLSNLVQVDGYGAPGSSGSPIFNRDGRVVAVLYGGERESNGKIIFAIPASYAVEYLSRLGINVR